MNNALMKNGSWVLVPKPPNVDIVRSMSLFRHKYHADGSLKRYKACLVDNKHSQRFVVDCEDTFSLVVKPVTIHIVPNIEISQDWPTHQLDVKNVFVNNDLPVIVYIYVSATEFCGY